MYKTVAGEPVSYQVPLFEDDTPCFVTKLRTFVDAVKEGDKAPVPSSEILYNQAIIDGICRSAELGREIEIDIPEI